MLTLPWGCELCVCVSVLGAYASHHIFILEAAPTLPTHTHLSSLPPLLRAAHWAVCLPARISWLRARLSACALCMSVYISTCLSACSVKSGHQGFFNCFLPPTAPKHCEAEHSSAVWREHTDRERQSRVAGEVSSCVPQQKHFHSICSILTWQPLLGSFCFALRILAHLHGGHAARELMTPSVLTPVLVRIKGPVSGCLVWQGD